VCVTGAAGQIAYSLLYSLAKGEVFGANQVRDRCGGSIAAPKAKYSVHVT